ncbi:phosphatase PAP2 family protein [Zymobacter palmae]|uniref:undecaprenyl-diphosphate phosphatase n=1 Tax=Zymobacter palmae TaxID=33074 RepID=A0A348HF22_9GAMM|nr:phosphatase PAP2 family protein [Zymobacter palmae]BBG30224.1 membrane-associated phospholipid phosphatase [Zymobacter palmae]
MEALNLLVFSYINAPAHPSMFMLGMAHFFATYAIWVVPTLLMICWLRRNPEHHYIMLNALLATGAALLVNNVIGMLWHHPRPFAMPTGHNFLYHEADPSFPSDHMTVIMTVAFTFLLRHRVRLLGLGLAVLGTLIGWSRIYLGVHFPIDMAGAVIVAFSSAFIIHVLSPLFMPSLYMPLRSLYRKLFAPLIKRGWLFH